MGELGIALVLVGLMAGYFSMIWLVRDLLRENFRLNQLLACIKLATAEATPPMASALAVKELAKGWNLHPPETPPAAPVEDKADVTMVGSL